MEAFDLELARLLRADGQLAEARGLLDGLLDQHPALAEARWERAGLEDQAGNRDEALADLDRLIEQWSAASLGTGRWPRLKRCAPTSFGRSCTPAGTIATARTLIIALRIRNKR